MRCWLLFLLIAPPVLQAADLPRTAAIEALVKGLADEKLFNRGDGKAIRSLYVDFIESILADEIKSAFGNDYPSIMNFLNQNSEIKELLLTAIDPDVDQTVNALQVFRDLWKNHPEKVKEYPHVAVACAVVWDNHLNVYDYRGHQIRTRSEMPTKVMENRHLANFQYLIQQDTPFKTTLPHLPWELLVHVVNHYTPMNERSWVISNYQKRKGMIGKTYGEVKYDMEMLRSEMRNGPGSGQCRLTGQTYSLENLRRFGGVCAQQADFATRVAKSLAVPAEFVGGEANSGGQHAWVMWVEIKSATKDKLDVTLLSEGRYLNDQYYLGDLLNPQSGQVITDRQMELRLASVVLSPKDSRQADLLMRVFPIIRDAKKLDPKQQLDYLRKVIELFPYSDRAWSERAALIKSGASHVDPQSAMNVCDTSFRIFHNYPDFSWKYADDLLTPVKNKQPRASQFEKLATRYEQLNRPDLACQARLKLVDYQTEAKDFQKAAEGLTKTIAKFSAEGRYVPRMLDKLQSLALQYKGGAEKLVAFYLQFLPTVPATRGNEVSEYCIKVHEQALVFVQKHGKPNDAKRIEQQLLLLKRNSPRGQ